MDSHAFCPEDRVNYLIPACVVTFTTFDDGLPDIAVSSFDYTVSLRVIWRNANRMNPILARKFIYCKPICRSVIGNDFSDWSPSAE
jgi:hypothetical protein